MSTALELPENFEPLDKLKHRELKFSKLEHFNFAKTISSVPVSFPEMQLVSQYYPIILSADDLPTPMALLSLEEGANQYVDEQGRWKVPYIPLCLRLYPFILAKAGNKGTKEDQYVLCLDRTAEHFAGGQGDLLFTEAGEPSEFVKTVFKTLTLFQQELAATQTLFAQLADKQIVVDRKFEFQSKGQQKSVDGFKGVDMEKLITLDDKSIAGFVKDGTMPLVYIHLQSLSKFALIA